MLGKYLNTPEDFVKDWKEYMGDQELLSQKPELTQKLIPFFGSDNFKFLTDEQKSSLFHGFIQMNAEVFCLLELVFIFGLRRSLIKINDRVLYQASRRFIREEYYHSLGFKAFLKKSYFFDQQKKSFYLKGRPFLRKWLAWIALNAPISLTLPGAKVEAFGLSYANYLKEIYGGWDANAWTRLHRLHLSDETYHVPLQYLIYKGLFKKTLLGSLKTWLFTFSFFLTLQVMLVMGAEKLLRDSFLGQSRLRIYGKIPALGHWITRDFKPYKLALQKTRSAHLQELPLGKWMKYLSW